MKEYYHWVVYRFGGNRDGRFKVWVSSLTYYEKTEYFAGRLQMTFDNHKIIKNKIGLLEFIVEELFPSERSDVNVNSSLIKLLKRLDRI